MHVYVLFFGVCTHVNTEPDLTRVVLVDARFGRIVDTSPPSSIPPHAALLSIDPRFIAKAPTEVHGLTPVPAPFLHTAWTLGGVQLEIHNARGTLLPPLPDYTFLPSLKASARAVGEKSVELSRDVVDGGAAAGVFFIRNGQRDAFLLGQAAIGMVKLDVAGEHAELRVTRAYDREPATIVLQKTLISGIEIDPVIALSNTGIDDDDNVDFLLNYDVTTFTPKTFITPLPLLSQIRTPNAADQLLLDLVPVSDSGLTHGCSNSTYP